KSEARMRVSRRRPRAQTRSLGRAGSAGGTAAGWASGFACVDSVLFWGHPPTQSVIDRGRTDAHRLRQLDNLGERHRRNCLSLFNQESTEGLEANTVFTNIDELLNLSALGG